MEKTLIENISNHLWSILITFFVTFFVSAMIGYLIVAKYFIKKGMKQSDAHLIGKTVAAFLLLGFYCFYFKFKWFTHI